MAKNASDILVETLQDWGVDTIFGLPGDGINGIMEALRKKRDEIRFVHVCHEEAAAFMACGYAKFTGRLGCCLATSGPGGIHLLNGLYDAKLDGQPVVAITGLQFHDLTGTHTQQDVALDRLFMDVAVFNERVMGAAQVRNIANLACRTALAYCGVAHITIPVDTQEQSLADDEPSKRNRPESPSKASRRASHPASPGDLERAAAILNEGQRVAILAGRGAIGAGEILEQTADLLAAPIVKALLGKSCVPDDSPFTTGGIGLLGTLPSVEALAGCDTLLIAGSSFPYLEYYPKPGKAKCVQMERDESRIGLRYPVDVGLAGDTRATLEGLLPLLKRRDDRHFLESAQKGMQRWNELMLKRATSREMPMKPQVVAHELGLRLAANAIIATDSGTVTTWWARHVPAKRGQMHSCSGNLASMGCALPYAIAAQVAYPDRPVVAIIGDGAFLMLMAEIATCVRYRLPIKIVVFKNNTLAQIKWEQIAFLGNPEYGCELPDVDYVGVARACGAAAFRVDHPDRCGEILDQAFRTEGPVLIEAVVDPLAAPMPPNITAEEMLHFAEAVAKGTPQAGEIVKRVLGERIRELV